MTSLLKKLSISIKIGVVQSNAIESVWSVSNCRPNPSAIVVASCELCSHRRLEKQTAKNRTGVSTDLTRSRRVGSVYWALGVAVSRYLGLLFSCFLGHFFQSRVAQYTITRQYKQRATRPRLPQLLRPGHGQRLTWQDPATCITTTLSVWKKKIFIWPKQYTVYE